MADLVAARIPAELAHRADRLQAPLLRRELQDTDDPPARMSRARVLSLALRRGLSEIEAEIAAACDQESPTT